MFRLLRLFLVALTISTLGACQVPPPQQTLPELSALQGRPWRLDVGRLELVSDYAPPLRDPNVEHLMPVSPSDAVQKWAQARLQPAGRSGTARLVIKDAAVVETPLNVATGVGGLFKKEQSARYDAKLSVAFQILDERGMPVAEVETTASRSRTTPEDVTLNQRDRIWFEMVDAMLSDLNAQFDPLIGQYMARWVM